MSGPNGVSNTGGPHSRVDNILELIDNALADYQLQLVQLRTAVDNRPVPR
jgi:hypothetical protein